MAVDRGHLSGGGESQPYARPNGMLIQERYVGSSSSKKTLQTQFIAKFCSCY